MALLYIDSFDHYTSLVQKGWNVGANASITTSGRNGTAGRMINQGNNSGSYRQLPSNYATLVVGVGIFVIENSEQRDFLFLGDSGTNQVGLRLNSGMQIQIRRNGTLIQTGSMTLSLNIWYYIEFKATINNTTGAYEIRVNGVTDFSNTGQNTRASANNYANQVCFQGTSASGGSTSGRVDTDDIYILDTSGSPSDFIGDIRVQSIYPSMNGNSSQLIGSDSNSTDNYLLVDETAPNSDTDYVESGTSTEKDTYAFGDVTPTAGTVYAVQILPFARKTDAGLRQIRPVARVSSNETDGDIKTLTTDYLYYPDIMVDKPGGGSWSITDVNSAEFGVKVV